MLPVGAGNGHDQGIVADLPVLAAPGGHVGHGVGPADAHTALVRRQPAVGAAPHPVVVVAQGHHPHAVGLGQGTGAVHGTFGVQRPEAPVPVPALHGTERGHTGGPGGGVDLALVQVAHHPGKPVQAMAVHPGQTVLGKDDSGIPGVIGGESFLFQHAGKLGHHGFIGHTFHGGISFFQRKFFREIVSAFLQPDYSTCAE